METSGGGAREFPGGGGGDDGGGDAAGQGFDGRLVEVGRTLCDRIVEYVRAPDRAGRERVLEGVRRDNPKGADRMVELFEQYRLGVPNHGRREGAIDEARRTYDEMLEIALENANIRCV